MVLVCLSVSLSVCVCMYADLSNQACDICHVHRNVHYQMLKHLPESALSTLLHIINKHWCSKSFPSIWHHAVVLPIPKADKDKTDPCSYRPIALTSCLCKIIERMINDRLVWYLEKHKLITRVQSGFRKNRSTTDQLVRLESFVREAFILQQHVVAVFFDYPSLSKAFFKTDSFK